MRRCLFLFSMITRTRLCQAAPQRLRYRFRDNSILVHRQSYSDAPINKAQGPADLSAKTTVVNHCQWHEGWLFADSVFPIQIAKWDFRHYIGLLREESLLEIIGHRLEHIQTQGFKITSLEPYKKDGGVFIRFIYKTSDPENALKSIEHELSEAVVKHGGLPSWLGFNKGNIWMVKGTPWREDLDRYASPIVSVAFDGPDIQEQSLYELFRPFGRIQRLTVPGPVPVGTPRSTTITFSRLHSATIARNVLHGFCYTPVEGSGKTLLRTAYQRPVQAHAIRDWMSSHPKITLPLLVFLLGTLTYTVFDPIRSLMVQGKMLDWFDYREFRLYKWLRTNAFDLLAPASNHTPVPVGLANSVVWRERKEAVSAIKTYLSDFPTTIEFIHGPQGSGKTRLLETVLKDSGRKAMIIDCRALQNTTSDSQIVASLAAQTGYWPVFTFLNSVNNLIDLASVGLIGQKVGLNSSLDDQLRQILAIVGTALKGVNSSHLNATKRQIHKRERERSEKENQEYIWAKIERGVWHDGRLDCVAGNGIMSELGVGDEPMLVSDESSAPSSGSVEEKFSFGETPKRQSSQEEMEAVRSLPIVVIRNYAVKVGSNRVELLNVLAQWAAILAENQVAHVIVMSDNRENAKYLAKALPSKPLSLIALSDADSRSSISFVRQKLRDADIDVDLTSNQIVYVERLGGRSSDLESLVHQIRNGQPVEDAVENIISRGVAELRKSAFGDDVDDAKSLLWTREQAWTVLKLLSGRNEVPYHDVLVEFPFKGDETPLRSMEHAELISIGTHEGRPSMIRPGKPVLKWVFQRLVNDPIFRATQEISLNEKVIAAAEKTVKSCEEELITISSIASRTRLPWWQFGCGDIHGTSVRSKHLAEKLASSAKKIAVLEKKNLELKRVLAKGDP
ncbi:hypothetical protein H2248_009688 [Termitomyces sp. 'cryptogamus']|nr:hypothetical protein H2248_009688 [Termitomyces sp. 'cryptogamus']